MRVHSSGTTTSDLVQVCIGTSLLPGYHTNLLEISDTARKLILAIIVAFVMNMHIGPASAGTIDDMFAKGWLDCGVSRDLRGFSSQQANGEWSGFDVDFCRAVAAATLGDAEAVRFTPLSPSEGFTSLKNGDINLLANHSTWTSSGGTELGLTFPVVTFFDTQVLIVRKDMSANSTLQLSGSYVCVIKGTTSAPDVADYFTKHGMQHELVTSDTFAKALVTYDNGGCDALAADRAVLHGLARQLSSPGAHYLLPENISRSPTEPAIRMGDAAFADAVQWVHFAMLNAEHLGVNTINVWDMDRSTDPAIMRLLGKTGAFGSDIGLTNVWATILIRNVGNYGEVYDRNLGQNTPLALARGQNALWTNGGLQFAPPIR